MLGCMLVLFVFVSFCAMLVVSERRVSACLIMLSTKQVSHWYHFNAFGMGSNPRPPALEADALPFALSGPVSWSRCLYFVLTSVLFTI